MSSQTIAMRVSEKRKRASLDSGICVTVAGCSRWKNEGMEQAPFKGT
jgi:hypothetical protein